MKRMRLLLLFCLLISIPPAIAQKIKTVEGSAQVRMELNMTQNDTEKRADEAAKIDAIQNAFGTVANQEFNMLINDGRTDYNVIAKTVIRGEWVETTGKYFEEDFKQEKTDEGVRNIKWVTCYIKGKARELTPRAQIDFYPLNSPDFSKRTTEFTNEGDLFLYFKSPVDGYLSVYLDDGTVTSRLLPDTYSPSVFDKGVHVISDKDYIFFAPDQNNLQQEEVEEYMMFTTQKVEYNYMYIIFSENPFVKPILHDIQIINGDTIPKSLRSDKFQQWLTDNKYADPTFQVRQMAITIIAN